MRSRPPSTVTPPERHNMECAQLGYSSTEREPDRPRLPRLPPRPSGQSPKRPSSLRTPSPSEPEEEIEAASDTLDPPAAPQRRSKRRANISAASNDNSAWTTNTNSKYAKTRTTRAKRPAGNAPAATQDDTPIVVKPTRRITRRQTRERFPEPEEPAETAEPAMPMVAGMAPEPTGIPPRRPILRSRAARAAPVSDADDAPVRPAIRRAKRVSFYDAGVEETTEVETGLETPSSADESQNAEATPTKTSKKKRKRSSTYTTLEAADSPKSSKSPRTSPITNAAVADASTSEPTAAPGVPVEVEVGAAPPTEKVPTTPRRARRSLIAPGTPSTPVNATAVDNAVTRALALRGFAGSQVFRSSSQASQSDSSAEPEPAAPLEPAQDEVAMDEDAVSSPTPSESEPESPPVPAMESSGLTPQSPMPGSSATSSSGSEAEDGWDSSSSAASSASSNTDPPMLLNGTELERTMSAIDEAFVAPVVPLLHLPLPVLVRPMPAPVSGEAAQLDRDSSADSEERVERAVQDRAVQAEAEATAEPNVEPSAGTTPPPTETIAEARRRYSDLTREFDALHRELEAERARVQGLREVRQQRTQLRRENQQLRAQIMTLEQRLTRLS